MALLALSIAMLPAFQIDLDGHPINSGIYDASAVVIADVDGDGSNDVVVASRRDGRLIWFQQSAGQAYGVAREISRGAEGVASILVEDFDGDGNVDVVASSQWRQRLTLHRGLGGGAFAPLEVLLYPANQAAQVSAVDMDGDGRRDVLAAIAGLDTVGWLRNEGGGVFGALQAVTTTTPNVRAARAADMNGDGNIDVVTAAIGSGRVELHLSDGVGGFNPPQLIATKAGELLVELGDMDLDGSIDVVVGSGSTYGIETLTNDGSTLPSFGVSFRSTWRDMEGLQLVDIDGDADLDILYTNTYRAGWLEYGNPAGGGAWMQPDGGDHTVITAGDLGSGGIDVVLGRAFSIEVLPDVVGSTSNARVVLTDGFTMATAVTLDVEGDGDLDVVGRSGAGLRTYANDGSGAFTPAGFTSFPTEDIWYLASGDIDGDGLEDLVVAVIDGANAQTVRWLRNEGGTFSAPIQVRRYGSASGVSIAGISTNDVDADGDVDIVMDQRSGGGLQSGYFPNSGSGFPPGGARMAIGSGRLMDLADFTGDGLPDALMIGISGRTEFQAQEPSGLFGQPTYLPGTSPTWARFLDGDGDGQLDVIRQSSTGALEIYLRTAASRPSTTASIASPVFERLAEGEFIDIEGDGDLDVLAYVERPTPQEPYNLGLAVIERESSGQFAAPSFLLPDLFNAKGLHLADMDGDGLDDLLSSGRPGWSSQSWYRNTAELGGSVCGGVANSTGRPAELFVGGQANAATNDLVLSVRDLPAGSSTLFLVAPETGFAQGPGGSQGNFCLSGPIGRFVGPGQLQQSTSQGVARLRLDLTALPGPNGPSAAIAGQTWVFQAWYRDANPGAVSNFSSAVEVAFD